MQLIIDKLIGDLKTSLGLTVFLVTHDLDTLFAICDRVAVLEFGEKIAEGTPDEIRVNPQVIAAYLGKQADANEELPVEAPVAMGSA